MNAVDETPAPAKETLAGSTAHFSATDSIAHLATAYRDFPGLRALILRRAHDPEVAADILQDAAVTTLEKLKSGEIENPENIGGYLYRVALNHLRNHSRKHRAANASTEALDAFADPDEDVDRDPRARERWAAAALHMLAELPAPRDRELLIRFYLKDDNKEHLCQKLGLSDRHFNRVLFRARNRFRELLKRRGLSKSDFFMILAFGLSLGLSFSAAVSMASRGKMA